MKIVLLEERRGEGPLRNLVIAVGCDGCRRRAQPEVAHGGVVEAADGGVHEEEEEELVVVGADAVVDKGAVVVHPPHAAIARAAPMCGGGEPSGVDCAGGLCIQHLQ